MKQKAISKEGESIIRLPNKVVVTVKKRHEIRYRSRYQSDTRTFYRKNEINEEPERLHILVCLWHWHWC